MFNDKSHPLNFLKDRIIKDISLLEMEPAIVSLFRALFSETQLDVSNEVFLNNIGFLKNIESVKDHLPEVSKSYFEHHYPLSVYSKAEKAIQIYNNATNIVQHRLDFSDLLYKVQDTSRTINVEGCFEIAFRSKKNVEKMRRCLSDWKMTNFKSVTFKFLLPFDLGMYETKEFAVTKAHDQYFHVMGSSQNLPFRIKPTLSEVETYSLIHKIAAKI